MRPSSSAQRLAAIQYILTYIVLLSSASVIPSRHVATSFARRKTYPNSIAPAVLYDNSCSILLDAPTSSDVSTPSDTGIIISASARTTPDGDEHNIGDSGAIAPAEIPSLATGPAVSSASQADPAFWIADDGGQKPLMELNQEGIDGLWADNLVKGQAIKKWLDTYIASGRSRLDSMPRSAHPLRIATHYDTFADAISSKVQTTYSQVNEPFAQIGVSPAINGDVGFTFSSIASKKDVIDPNLQGHSVIDVACNYERGVLISLAAFRAHDGNDDADQLRSSELTWQTWQNGAYSQGESWEQLQYVQQHSVLNQDTANIMTLAHLRFPERVDHIPIPNPGGSPMYPTSGHAVWYPPTSDTDEAGKVWTRLLNTPNVKPIVHLLADHNDDLDYPYPVAIHTFCEVKEGAHVPRGAVRGGTIIVVLGHPPFETHHSDDDASMQSISSGGTIDTE